jgi:hypothetical protein
MEQPDLERDVVALARRVAVLEERLGLRGEVYEASAPAGDGAAQALSPADPSEIVPVLGRALLGLAGAYLLRAVTEAGTLGGRAGVTLGVLYAVGWLVWAARTPAERRLQAAVHSLTAVLVIAPLLWEATLRFHAISNWTAAGILLLFTLFGLGVSWKKDLLVVSTIATLAGLGTAAAMLMATHDVLPFTYLFLAVAAAVELSACLDHWLSERWLAATAANLSVLLATWLATNERGLPEGYARVDSNWLLVAQMALLGIYLSSIIVRTLLRQFTFTKFETAQCAIAFAISVGCGLRVTPAMAIPAVACGMACYVVAFAVIERQGRTVNFYTYSTFGLLLLLAGSRILLAGMTAAGVWGTLAVLCMWAGARSRSLTLQVHGGVFLLAALGTSGALQQAAAFLIASANWPGEQLPALLAGLPAAALAYLFAIRASGGDPDTWNIRWFRLAIAATLAWLCAGAAAGALTAGYHAIFGPMAAHAYCATLRTTVLAGGALLLGAMGARWKIPELSRLIYPTMALGAFRLLTQDLHQDRTAALFLSLLVFGAALLALPRLRRTEA